MTKGFKDDKGKFHPIGNSTGLKMKQGKSLVQSGIKMKTSTQVKHKEWGFDLTDFKAGGFQKVLKELGIPEGSVTDDMGRRLDGTPYRRGFIWSGEGIEITTGNNPITGEYNNPRMKENEKDYASYIGIEGVPELVDKAVKLIKQNTVSIKNESQDKREFI